MFDRTLVVSAIRGRYMTICLPSVRLRHYLSFRSRRFGELAGRIFLNNVARSPRMPLVEFFDFCQRCRVRTPILSIDTL